MLRNAVLADGIKWEKKTVARTAIDRKTGAPWRGRLFEVEYVPEGTTFTFTWIYTPRGIEDIQSAFTDHAVPLLQHMSRGFNLGRGSKAAAGRMRLNAVACWLMQFGKPDGQEIALTLNQKAESKSSYVLTLACPGPYLPLAKKQTQEAREKVGKKRRNTLEALVDESGNPALNATTVLGALRAACARHDSMCDGHGDDADNPDKVFLPDGDPDSDLTFTERLFGVCGWKGLLEIDAIKCTKKGKNSQEIGAVGIDRFSGAVLDAGPFFAQPFIGCEYEVKIRFGKRKFSHKSGKEFPGEKDMEFFKTMLAHVSGDTGEGLFLGWGAARGYGWFTVAEKKETADGER